MINDIKYVCEFEFVENCEFDVNKQYPNLNIDTIKYDENIQILNFYSSIIKVSGSDSKQIVDKLKKRWDSGYSDFLMDIKGEFNKSQVICINNIYYLILENDNFVPTYQFVKDRISIFEYLGVINVTNDLKYEMYELDQNLQGISDKTLLLELMAENTDLSKYIEFIDHNLDEQDLQKEFFFDEYVYKLIAKMYAITLNEIAPYKNDIYGRVAMKRFIESTLTGVNHDECRCCSI